MKKKCEHLPSLQVKTNITNGEKSGKRERVPTTDFPLGKSARGWRTNAKPAPATLLENTSSGILFNWVISQG